MTSRDSANNHSAENEAASQQPAIRARIHGRLNMLLVLLVLQNFLFFGHLRLLKLRGRLWLGRLSSSHCGTHFPSTLSPLNGS